MTDKEVRVRFCPSPTGTPHVGMVRSCLFNYAWAKHCEKFGNDEGIKGGKFVFRIEDTDHVRDSEDSYQMILTSLKWLGLNWDEGVEVGGPDGPYRQSERTQIYRDVAKSLLDKGYAYKCFSTKEEIDTRNKAAGRPVQFGYDNFDRNLTDEQIKEYENEGREFTIRVKMPQDQDITFDDIVRGEVTFKAGTIPDYVIVRSSKDGNGDPLYTLTNPVDDALMNVNCILRGEDLLSSTPRQVVLWKYLIDIGVAKEPVKYGHLPYVMGEGNKKLSKRDPESNLFLHREKGMIPEGLINYLALLGWSLSPDDDIFSMDQLVEAFNPKDVLANPARFDMKKCTAINAEHIRMLDVEDFKKRLIPYLHGSVSADFVNCDLLREIAENEPDMPKLQTYQALVSADKWDNLTEDEQRIITAAAPLIQTRVQLLSEARNLLAPLLSKEEKMNVEEDAKKQLKSGKNPSGEEIDYHKVIETAINSLKSLENWTTDSIHNTLQEALSISPEGEPDYQNSLNLKPRFAFSPLRVAISGKRISPPLFECMEILGKDLTIKRLENLD
ncbi:MAG: glutamate--tRNA ligase [Candidatus Ancillula sp.]|jgi:glutamyl-tRNA synthetase|nr:glutamate--tRNA ligase [Candidatus Ancillula sp.]